MVLDKLNKYFYLDDREAGVYLAALELGRAKVSAIAQKAGINRITAYEILKRFVGRGLATSYSYGNVKTFEVLSPDNLIEKMESTLESAKQVLPELALLTAGVTGRPRITYYEGAEGIRTIYEDTLLSKEKIIYNIADPEKLFKTIGEDFFSQYLKRRIRRKIQVQGLLPDTPTNKKYQNKQTSELRIVRYFAEHKYPFENEVMIYDNKLALLSFSGLLGVIIENDSIVRSVKSIWQMAWDSLV